MARGPDLVRTLLALHGERRFADMEAAARKALRSEPDSAVLNELVGIALTAQSRHSDALPFLVKATRHGPGDAQFWENLGLCQFQLNQHAPAADSLRRALALRPSHVAAGALGAALTKLQQLDEAHAVLARAVATYPQQADLHRAFAKLLLDRNAPQMAEGVFAKAAALDAFDWRSRLTLAKLLLQRGAREQAGTVAMQALDILGPVKAGNPEMLAAWDDIAGILYRGGMVDIALDLCKDTYELAPSPARALMTNMIAREACDWNFAAGLEPAARELLDNPEGIGTISPWFLLGLGDLTPDEQFRLTQGFVAAAHGNTTPRQRTPVQIPEREKIRLGYLSADFYNHPTSVLLAGVIEHHDRGRFELVACDLSPPVRDYYRTRLEATFGTFLPLRDLCDEAAAEAIAREKIDIVIDLNGWTLGGRPSILASRPAAIQMQWLGYPGTLAAPWIDYIIADGVVIPPGADHFYLEKVIRLPETYQPNDRGETFGHTPTRRQYSLPDDALVLCCFNQMFKITPDVFALWMRILKRTPAAVLWLMASSEGATRQLHAMAQRHDVAPERLIFSAKADRDIHLARLALADLAVDCAPYGSHTTASDAIRAGVPLIALQGDIFAARVSASIVRAAGFPELVASGLDEYEEMACRLLADPAALSALRARVIAARQSSILFDPARFARQLEQALLEAFGRARSGLPPAAIDLRRGQS